MGGYTVQNHLRMYGMGTKARREAFGSLDFAYNVLTACGGASKEELLQASIRVSALGVALAKASQRVKS